MAEVSFEGKQAVFDRLKALAPAVTNKGARFALRKGANLVAEAAKQSARALDDPETGRSIADNIAVRFSNRTFKRTGDILFRVGVMGGAVLPKDHPDFSTKAPTPHWRLLELGREGVPARPFMRPALSENAQAVLDTTASQLNAWLDRYFKRQAK